MQVALDNCQAMAHLLYEMSGPPAFEARLNFNLVVLVIKVAETKELSVFQNKMSMMAGMAALLERKA